MTPHDLMAAFEVLAEAPEGVGHLRDLLLRLAVRGRLVPQDPSDGSACELLPRAREWMASRPRAARSSRWTPSPAINDCDAPYELPAGWAWARINDTASYTNGMAFKNSQWGLSGLPIIRIQNLTDPQKPFNHAECDPAESVLVRDGDILVSWSATLEAFVWRGGNALLNQHIFRVDPCTTLLTKGFLFLLLRRVIREMAEGEHAHGLVMTHINRGPFLSHIVGIPPLAEQERIVARVDALMGLLDRLEAARTTREATRAAVRDSALAALREAEAPEEIEVAWDRFAERIDDLVFDPADIAPLRQAVLALAVRGLLITHDALDGSEVWEAGAVGEYLKFQNGYAFESSWYVRDGVRVLRNQNVGHGSLDWTDEKRVDHEHAREFQRFALREGDIVLSLDRPLISTGLKVARLGRYDVPSLLLQRVARPVFKGSRLSPDFLYLWLRSPDFTDAIDPGRSNGVPHISTRDVEHMRLRVPPIPEQHRIVARVDELMGLLDRLEERLAAVRTTHAAFAAAAVSCLYR